MPLISCGQVNEETRSLKQEAGNHFNNRNYEASIKVLNKLLNIEPYYDTAYFQLGVNYLYLNNSELAELNFKKCIEINKEYAQVYVFMGIMVRGTGKELDLWETAMSKAKDNATKGTAAGFIGEMYFDQGDYVKAINYFETAIPLEKSRYFLLESLGDSYVKLGNLDKAKVAYQKQIKIDSSNIKVWHKLAEVKSKKGDYQEAIADLMVCLEIDPQNNQTLHNLGYWLYETGEFKKSNSYLNRVTIDYPKYYMTRTMIAKVNHKMGDQEKACKLWNSIISELYKEGYEIEEIVENVSGSMVKTTRVHTPIDQPEAIKDIEEYGVEKAHSKLFRDSKSRVLSEVYMMKQENCLN